MTVTESAANSLMKPINKKDKLNLIDGWPIGTNKFLIEREPYKIGGMCMTHRGLDINDGKLVIVRYSYNKIGSEKNLIQKEFDLLSHINHPLIPKVYGLYIVQTPEDKTSEVMVMEYVRGQNLSDRLNQNPPLSADQLSKIVTQLGQLVDELHLKHSLYHGDLKPGQVMLKPDDSVNKVLDFLSSNKVDPHGKLCTPEFASPERQSDGIKNIQTEVYSLAALTYYALTGNHVYVDGSKAPDLKVVFKPITKNNTKYALDQDAIELLNIIFSNALAKDPKARFENAEVFSALFSDIMNNIGTKHSLSLIAHSLTHI